jgi:hypothetical protein
VLASVVAFLLIALTLAIISALGERRLAQLRSQAFGPVSLPRAVRPTPGLQAPLPVPERTTVQRFSDPQEPRAIAPPGAGGNPPIVAAPQFPTPIAVPMAPLAVIQPQQFSRPIRPDLAVAISRIRDAFLGRPDAGVNLTQFRRPVPTEDLVHVRVESRLSPQAMRQLAEARRATQTLADRRAEARLARSSVATTRPSI